MNNEFLESRRAIEQAREALRRGDRNAALKWGQEAARLAPQSEDPWLILAAVASPQASVNYIKRALEANPESVRARRGMQWAMQRLQASPPSRSMPSEASARAGGAVPQAAIPSQAPAPAARPVQKTSGKIPRFILPVLLLALGCLVVFAAAFAALRTPALAAIRSLSQAGAPAPAPTQPPRSWAQAELPKPTYTPTAGLPTRTPAATATRRASATPRVIASTEATATPEAIVSTEATATPGDLASIESSVTPEALMGGMQAVIVEDTPTSEFAPPAVEPIPGIAAAVYGERWIDVNLSQQVVYAYEGETLMNSFIVSTGTWQTPTVTGTYKIWIKLRSTTMTGPGYYLTNVPYTMYFYKGYGLHGTYWHNNFGVPMSHGCVNLTTWDAEWLYNFASVGTTVNVHY